MQLTKKFVKAKNPCAGGYKWFLRDHNGQGDYQACLLYTSPSPRD